ncbi:MAG: hypothetical protein ACKVZH_05520 [Blastocatellia bacterium]
MTTMTIQVPDELSEQLKYRRDQVPELLAIGLQKSPLPAQVYRYVLDFIASGPTPEQIAAFEPTPEMRDRLKSLLARERTNETTPFEKAELDEYERIEHIVVMLKAGNLPYVTDNQ